MSRLLFKLLSSMLSWPTKLFPLNPKSKYKSQKTEIDSIANIISIFLTSLLTGGWMQRQAKIWSQYWQGTIWNWVLQKKLQIQNYVHNLNENVDPQRSSVSTNQTMNTIQDQNGSLVRNDENTSSSSQSSKGWQWG